MVIYRRVLSRERRQGRACREIPVLAYADRGPSARGRLDTAVDCDGDAGGYRVNDSDNHHIAYVYCKDDHQVPMMPEYLTRDEARRVAKAIARLPELLKPKA